MYTSSYSKNIVHATSNGLNSFNKSVTETSNYTGDTRIAYKKTIPASGSVRCSIALLETGDYFASFSATNSNSGIVISYGGSPILTLDSLNNYSAAFLATSNDRDNYSSTDDRYSYFGVDYPYFDVGNSGNISTVFSFELLTQRTT